MDRPVLLFDADCGFCARVARHLARASIDTNIIALQSENLAAWGVDPQRAQREIPFVEQTGQVRYGADAIAAAMGTGSRRWRVASHLLRSWPIRYLAAVGYRIIARYRHVMPGGTGDCELMTASRT